MGCVVDTPRPTHILGTVNDVAYNENHTTSTKRPIVETMASSDKVVVNAEHIAEHGGSLKRAMELWSSRNGPVNYNTWQSLYFALLRDHGLTDEELKEFK